MRLEAAQEHGAANEYEEAEVDISPARISDAKSSELVLPGQGALHHLAVPAQPLVYIHPRTLNTRSDAAPAQPSTLLLQSP